MTKLKVKKFKVHQLRVYSQEDFKPEPVKKHPVIGAMLFAGIILMILFFGLYGYPCSECIDLIFNPEGE